MASDKKIWMCLGGEIIEGGPQGLGLCLPPIEARKGDSSLDG